MDSYFQTLIDSLGNVWSNSYIECKCNGDKNKTLSVGEDLNEIRPCQNIINELK